MHETDRPRIHIYALLTTNCHFIAIKIALVELPQRIARCNSKGKEHKKRMFQLKNISLSPRIILFMGFDCSLYKIDDEDHSICVLL